MNTTTAALLVAAFCSVQQAHAETSIFNGLNLTLKSDIHNTSADFSNGANSFNVADTSSATSIQLENTFAFNTLHIGIGASIELSPLYQGKIMNAKINSDNMLALYLAPGVIVGESTLVYGKISLPTLWNKLSTDTSSATYKMNGLGLGAGAKFPLWNKIFAMLEINQNEYKTYKDTTNTEVKTKSTALSVGLGFYF